MSFGYSTATWAYYVVVNGKPAEPFQLYQSKAEAERKAAELGGTVKKTRY
jgi:hypothetical protein